MGDGPTQTQKTNQTTTTAPWAAAQPALKGLLGQIQGQIPNTGLTGNQDAALTGLMGNAQAGNPYAPQIGNLANDLLSGGTNRTGAVQGAYNDLNARLTPYTTASTDPYSNPAFKQFAGNLSNDITDQVKSQYAGAGYSPTSAGDFSQQLGKGISQGLAPAWMQASNDLENRKLGAINQLYGAGNQTAGLLSGMDQTALGNRGAGVGVAGAALSANDAPYLQQLQIEAQRRGIPIQNMAQLENLVVPMAQLGGTSNMVGQTTQQTQVPLAQQLIGAGIAGAGLLGAPFTGGASLGLTGMGANMFGGGSNPFFGKAFGGNSGSQGGF